MYPGWLPLLGGQSVPEGSRSPVVCVYIDFLVRSRLLTNKLLGQGYNHFKLITTFKKFYGRHYDLIGKFQHSVTHMVTDLFLETLFLR